jgi:hypothetical protein
VCLHACMHVCVGVHSVLCAVCVPACVYARDCVHPLLCCVHLRSICRSLHQRRQNAEVLITRDYPEQNWSFGRATESGVAGFVPRNYLSAEPPAVSVDLSSLGLVSLALSPSSLLSFLFSVSSNRSDKYRPRAHTDSRQRVHTTYRNTTAAKQRGESSPDHGARSTQALAKWTWKPGQICVCGHSATSWCVGLALCAPLLCMC